MSENNTQLTVNIEKCLASPIARHFTLDEDPDVLKELIAEKRSLNTQKAYLKDLTDFFRSMADSKAGITKTMSPHRIRHSSITAYLDASDGDLRGAQSLSRHKDASTLAIYDDNRHQRQLHATSTLSDLLDDF